MSKAALIECFAVSPILHEGERKVDCLVDLTQKQFDSLSKLEPSPIRKVEDSSGSASTATVDLEALKAAIDSLDPENKEHFMEGGKPQVKALSDALGQKLNAKQRDDLWQLYQDAQEGGGAE